MLESSFPQSLSGNPDVVPAKAGNQLKVMDSRFHGETLNARLSSKVANSYISCQEKSSIRLGHVHASPLICINLL
jgi:hypothetical protein